MNKTELVLGIQDICDSQGEELSKRQIGAVLEALAECVAECVESVDAVSIPGVGRVRCGLREARKGRNPATGESIDIAAKVAVRITPAKSLKQAVPDVKTARKLLST